MSSPQIISTLGLAAAAEADTKASALQKTANNLVTCLTDGHPGVSGGGVLNADGQLVGIPIGRMQGDYRFSFILPLRDEMFRRVKLETATH